MKAFFVFLFVYLPVFSDLIDLQDFSQDFVLETKRIEISGFPYAFNPSIIRWNGFILMSFRLIPDHKSPFTSWLGLVLLDESFNPIGEPQFLSVRENESLVPPRAEDARLIYLGDQLYIIYSDNPSPKINRGGFRMVIAELNYGNGHFTISNATRLIEYEGADDTIREKNWVPFTYGDCLLLAYSLSPHLIFYPFPGTGICETVARTYATFKWDWGTLRGGTPAFLMENGKYLGFFHSAIKMETINSNRRMMNHYFMGAYMFDSTPPFQITHISPEPIVGPGFYTGQAYKPYWGSIQCVFPTGMLMDGENIWVSYGRQDHELWVAKIDKRLLLESLSPVTPKPN